MNVMSKFYAVNLADLTIFSQEARGRGFSPVLTLIRPVLTEETVMCEGRRWDGTAVRVSQEHVDSGRFDAVLELVRRQVHKNKLRVYISKTGKGGWKRV